MMLLKRKYFYTIEEGEVYHMIKKKDWLPPQSNSDRLINLHCVTFCDIKHQLGKRDEYIPLDLEKHKKRICKECIRMFKMFRQKTRVR